MEVVRPPFGRLPDTETRDLPPPVPFRRMIGPSVILAGLSIGSGEFVLWPRLTAEYGFTLFWGAWIGVTLQFFLNMEIERYTLATGESAVIGFIRLARLRPDLPGLRDTAVDLARLGDRSLRRCSRWEIGSRSDATRSRAWSVRTDS